MEYEARGEVNMMGDASVGVEDVPGGSDEAERFRG